MALRAVLRISIAAVMEVCGVEFSVGRLRKSACVSDDGFVWAFARSGNDGLDSTDLIFCGRPER